MLTQVFMVCGTLLAIANGFIPSLSAMIYGGLTDELVVSGGLNCTLVEKISRLNISNVTELRLIHSKLPGIVINESSVVEVTLNGTRVGVKVIDANGTIVIREKFTEENVTAPKVNGTIVNGTKFKGIKLKGTDIKVFKMSGNLINGAKSEAANATGRNETKESAKGTKEMAENGNGNKTMNKNKGNNNSSNNDMKNSESRNSVTTENKEYSVDHTEGKIVIEGPEKVDSTVLIARKRRNKYETIIHEMELDDTNKNATTEILTTTARLPKMYTDIKINTDVKTNIPARLPGLPKFDTKLGANETKLQMNNSKTNNNITHQETKGNETRANETRTNETRTNETRTNETRTNETRTNQTRIDLNNITYVIRNITKKCYPEEVRIDIKMRKYAMYYLYAALATFVCAYGQIVFWNLASERGAHDLETHLTDSVLQQDPGFIDTKIYEGAPNLQELGYVICLSIFSSFYSFFNFLVLFRDCPIEINLL